MRSSAPATDRSRPTPSRKLRGVLLPAEHGSWGLIAEPLLLGLLVAPSLPGLAVAVFAFSAFLLRTPDAAGVAVQAAVGKGVSPVFSYFCVHDDPLPLIWCTADGMIREPLEKVLRRGD